MLTLPVIGPATALLLSVVSECPDTAIYATDPELWGCYVALVESAYTDAADHDRAAPALAEIGIAVAAYQPPKPWRALEVRLTPSELEQSARHFEAMALGGPSPVDGMPLAVSVVQARHAAQLRRLLPAMERRARYRAERLARLRRPVVTSERLPEGWLERAKLIERDEVFAAHGVATARGRWRGCPACSADVDATGRGFVAPFKRDAWVCNSCRATGDHLTWTAFLLTGARKPNGDVGRWYAARWNVA